MKKFLFAGAVSLSALFMMPASSQAQGTLIHYWNFNNFTSAVHLPDIASLGADFSVLDTAKARITYMPMPPGVSSSYTSYCDFVTGDTTNARMAAPAGNGFRARNPSDSMELLMYIPSTGYGNLKLSYASQASSITSGQLHQIFSYSVDSGSTWQTSGTGLSEWADSAWLSFNIITLRITDPAAYDNRKLVFRITFNGNASGTSGNNRFDNITLDGDVYHTSGVAAVAGISAELFPNPATENLTVTTNNDLAKVVTVVNAMGQTVYTANEQSCVININTTAFTPGNYFVILQDAKGNATKQAFVVAGK